MQGFEHGTATVSMDIIGVEKNYFHREPASLGARLRGLFGLWLLWHQRWRQRQHLAGLDAHLLRDIGVTHLAVLRETGKPFWRA